ncbi:MAG: NYN domain-containing protein [Parachlamydiaceae bacterium]
MHYYIDGYNLLFRTLQGGDDLKSKRKEVVTGLDAKVSLIGLDVTIVFDSHYQPDEHTRTHYNSLEIIFTAAGETADEFILCALKEASHPSQHTVVTSDRILARLCRMRLAKTEEVDQFLSWLSKRYHNKLKENQRPVPEPIAAPAKVLAAPVLPLSRTPEQDKPPEGCFDYYLSTFEEKYKEIRSNPKRAEKKAKKQKKVVPPPEDKPFITNMERWLRAFES